MATSTSGNRGVLARAWCRVDFAGGTLDIWPLGLLHHRSRTVNAAVDLAVEVELSPRREGYLLQQDDTVVEAESAIELGASEEGALIGLIAVELELPPLDIRVRSASPRGGGLGASSALAVAALAAAEALRGGPESSADVRSALARDIEARLMGLPTGRQDHFPALLGGVLEIRHELGGERVRRLAVDCSGLSRSLLVVYSGQSHFSAGANWRMIRRRLEGDPETIACFDGIRDVAEQLVEALEQGQLARVGELMSIEWSWRRRLAEGISTPTIERLLRSAEVAGAWGGKACGAGGGGCLVVLCPPDRQQEIARTLAEEGGEILPISVVDEALQVRAF